MVACFSLTAGKINLLVLFLLGNFLNCIASLALVHSGVNDRLIFLKVMDNSEIRKKS